jgi:parallel beta-helix repeat protein
LENCKLPPQKAETILDILLSLGIKRILIGLIYLIMYSKYRQMQPLELHLHPQVENSHSAQVVLRSVVSTILSCSLSLGVTGITLLATNYGRVAAQMPSLGNQAPPSQSTRSEARMLFVNPNGGSNTSGNGTQTAPFQTITHALQVATPNTMIMLLPGTYSEETGEVFPLRLKPGVVIEGDTLSKGQGIVIQGGGRFLSRSFGGQNVTIVGADRAELSGVTVSNPNPRGYGVWVESTNPVLTNNTFTGNTQDGVSVAGNSTPTIRQNNFYRNGANGLTIGGNSQPQIRENVFEDTGFGVNITQNAAPILGSNQIRNNRVGVIIQGNARPTLRNNLIEGNTEDGIVVLSQAIPNLGTIAEPGGNEFRSNGRNDINASAARETIPAAGNNLPANRVAGRVDFNAQTAPTAYVPESSPVANRVTPPTNQSQVNYINTDPNVVEFSAPQSPSPRTGTPPLGETPLAPVGNQNPAPSQNTAFNPSASSRVRYRVIVNVANDRERNLVRNLAPGAFPTVRQGRRVMQVGVFSDRTNADAILNVLNRNGLRPTIEQLN